MELTDLDCSTCTALQKRNRGCESDALNPEEIDGEVFKRCPRRPLLEDPDYFSDLFWGHQQFQKGIVPEEGGLLSQPGKLMQLYFLIDRTRTYCERLREADRRAEAERQRRAAQRRAISKL